MGERFDIAEDVRDGIMHDFSSRVDALLEGSSSGRDFQNNVELDISNSRLDRECDGADVTDDETMNQILPEYVSAADKYKNSSGVEAGQYLNQLRGMENEHPRFLNYYIDLPEQKSFEKAVAETEDNKAQTDKIYFKTTEERKPVDLQGIWNFCKNLRDHAFGECAKEAAQSAWVDTDDIAYSSNTYKSNGKLVGYKVYSQKVDWGSQLANGGGSLTKNIEKLRKFVSEQVIGLFGGFARISSIVVRSDQLIINNVCYCPMVDPALLRDASVFPLDVHEYIRNGYIAPLFDWSCLKRMSRLALLDIDDTDFYVSVVASDIGVGRRAGLSTIFNVVPSLVTFILGGSAVKAEEQHTEKGRVVKEKIATHKRFTNMSDSLKLDVYECTGALQALAFNNLRSYVRNKGNRGIIRLLGGVALRGAVAGGAGVLNLGVHLVGSVCEAFKDASSQK